MLSQTKGSDIFVGDILKLRESQIAPCDLLIIGTTEKLNGNYICRVDTLYEDGKSERQMKESISLTKSFTHWIEDDTKVRSFLQHLDARIEYHRRPGTHSIHGNFKLKADPRVEQFGDSNIVKKGAIMKSTHIYGLVLYNGPKCLDSNTRQAVLLTKSSGIEKKVMAFTMIIIVINVVCSILLNFLYKRMELFGQQPLVKVLDNKVHIISYLSLLFSCLPLSVNILLNLFHMVAAILLQSRYRNFTTMEDYLKASDIAGSADHLNKSVTVAFDKSKSEKPDSVNSFKVLNPNVIPDLGDIDDVFFDKTGTLSSTQFFVNTIALKRRLYQTQSPNFSDCIDERYTDIKESEIEHFMHTSGMKNSKKEDFRADVDEKLTGNKHPLRNVPPVKSKKSLESRFEHQDDDFFLSTPLKPPAGKPDSNRTGTRIIIESTHKPERVLEESAAAILTKNILNERNFKEDMIADANLRKILTVFAICHKARIKGSGYAHLTRFHSNIAEEAALLQLAKDFGVRYKGSNETLDDLNSLSTITTDNLFAGETQTEYFLINEHDKSSLRLPKRGTGSRSSSKTTTARPLSTCEAAKTRCRN